MRVGVLSPVWFPVPPGGYGGTEAIVHLLVEGLVDAGVDVTLFASGDSETSAELVAAFDEAPTERIGHSYWELQHLLPLLERRDEFDVLHDHSGLVGLTVLGLTSKPVVHTVHGPLTDEPGHIYRSVCGAVGQVGLVSLTYAQRRPCPDLPWIANVYNAIDASRYPLDRRPGDGLLFLGRMSPDKGAHRAVRIARRVGRPLKIAAKCREPEEIRYFEEHVEPHLGDGVEYVGEVGHDEKLALLAEAHALLVPIEWEEPFGLVMIEALACGTPVIALSRGSVPEILRDGHTAFVTDDMAGMVAAVDRVGELDPALLRREVEVRFSVEQLVQGYLEVYAAVARPTRRTWGRRLTRATPRDAARYSSEARSATPSAIRSGLS